MSPLAAATTRPRVEGEREAEILDAALVLLGRLGYDRLTMDAVAAEAKASKATLYRRWTGKPSLVVDAILRSKAALQAPEVDTGSLRGDLVALACCDGGLSDDRSRDVLVGVATALSRDPEFAAEFRSRVVAPKMAATRLPFERARDRGEISGALDPDLMTSALTGALLHRTVLLGLPWDEQTVIDVIDSIIMPAARASRAAPDPAP